MCTYSNEGPRTAGAWLILEMVHLSPRGPALESGLCSWLQLPAKAHPSRQQVMPQVVRSLAPDSDRVWSLDFGLGQQELLHSLQGVSLWWELFIALPVKRINKYMWFFFLKSNNQIIYPRDVYERGKRGRNCLIQSEIKAIKIMSKRLQKQKRFTWLMALEKNLCRDGVHGAEMCKLYTPWITEIETYRQRETGRQGGRWEAPLKLSDLWILVCVLFSALNCFPHQSSCCFPSPHIQSQTTQGTSPEAHSEWSVEDVDMELSLEHMDRECGEHAGVSFPWCLLSLSGKHIL